MVFDPEKLAKLPTLEEVEREIFSPDELIDIEFKAEERSRIRRSLSDQVSKALASYMSRE